MNRRLRSGLSLPELLVSLVILGILATALVGLVRSQGRGADLRVQQRAARTVARSSANLLLSELRMVEPTGGVRALSATSVEFDVPFALALSCQTTPTVTVVSLLPVDSTLFANARPDGYAWRDGAGLYRYQSFATYTDGAAPTACAAARIRTLPGGREGRISPPLPAGAPNGSAVFLLQRLRYWFGPSVASPGGLALFRTRLSDGLEEEVASPFDSTARFRFFVAGSDSAQAMPPASLSNLRGLALDLVGLSERPRAGGTRPERASLRTLVYFANAP